MARRYTLNDAGLPIGEGLYRMKGSPYIWAKVYVDGEAKPFSTKETDWREALRVRDERLSQQRTPASGFESVPLSELLTDYVSHLKALGAKRGDYEPQTAYITERVIKAHIERLLPKNLKATKFTTAMIREYRRLRLLELRSRGLGKECAKCGKGRNKTGSEAYTVDKEFGIIRAAMNLGAVATPKKFDKSLVPNFGIDKQNASLGTKENDITLEQYHLLLPHLPEWCRPIFGFCMFTGVRKKEARFIKRSAVNWQTRRVDLKALETKRGKKRTVQVPQAFGLWAAIELWESQTAAQYPKCEFLFHRDGEQLTTADLDTAFDNACLAAGLGHYRVNARGSEIRDARRCRIIDTDIAWHDSRRAFVTISGNLDGVTDLDRGRVAGQTSATQERYDRNNSAQKVADALDRKLGVSPTPSVISVPTVKDTPKTATQTWQEELRELKAAFEEGLIDQAMFEEERRGVMARRANVRAGGLAVAGLEAEVG